MIRKIIKIDEDRCNGCGICAQACHEGAIGIIDGKAKLLRAKLLLDAPAQNASAGGFVQVQDDELPF